MNGCGDSSCHSSPLLLCFVTERVLYRLIEQFVLALRVSCTTASSGGGQCKTAAGWSGFPIRELKTLLIAGISDVTKACNDTARGSSFKLRVDLGKDVRKGFLFTPCVFPGSVSMKAHFHERSWWILRKTVEPLVFLQDMKQYQEETLVTRKSTSLYMLICLLGFYEADKCLGI